MHMEVEGADNVRVPSSRLPAGCAFILTHPVAATAPTPFCFSIGEDVECKSEGHIKYGNYHLSTYTHDFSCNRQAEWAAGVFLQYTTADFI